MHSVHVFSIGLLLDVLCACLYEHLQNIPFTDPGPERQAIVYGTLYTLLLGIGFSLIGAVLMARSASGAEIIAAEMAIAFLTLLFLMRAKIGMDDPAALVPFFAGLVGLVLVVGRVFARRR
jgi:hypothetical protein